MVGAGRVDPGAALTGVTAAVVGVIADLGICALLGLAGLAGLPVG